MKKLLKNPISWLTLILLLYTLVGFLIVPLVIKNQTISLINDQFKREAKIESISFNPFTFELSIENFSLLDKNSETFLSLKKFYADVNILQIISGRIELENITVTNPLVTIKKLTESEFNFSDLIKSQEIPADSSWDILIKKVDVQNSILIFKDYSVNPAVEIFIDSANVELTNIRPISTDTTDFKAELQIRSGGNITANGMLTLEPLNSDLHYEVKGIDLNILNQYLLQFAKLNLKSGSISTSGDIRLSIQDTSKLPYVNYKGNLIVNDLSLLDSKNNQRVAKLGTLHTDGISIISSPLSVKINEIVLNELFAPVTLDPTIDIVEALRSIPGAVKNLKKEIEKLTNTSEKDFHFEIGEIKIENSEIILTDLSLPQKFTADIHSLNGVISGFSKDEPLGTLLQAEGIVEENGKAKIEGKIDLFDPLAYATLNINFQNIDLTRFTPYTMKFLGYTVKKGKLSLDLQYEIINEMLVSENKIYLDKLTLGEKVEKTDAFDLPIETAIALLKDKDGNIDLDVEVKGNLNDPEIDAGALIWWAVKRSFTKVVEAPFDYLGELLGISGEDLEYIEFSPGASELLPGQKQELAHLIEAMNQRPEIILKISGAANSVLDANALRSRKLNFIFTKRMTNASNNSLIDPLSIDLKISKNILETMYVEIFGKDSLEIIKTKYSGLADQNILQNYVKELVILLENNQSISQEEIYNLAIQRAETISKCLISTHKISPDRMVFLEPEIDDIGKENKIKCRLEIGAI